MSGDRSSTAIMKERMLSACAGSFLTSFFLTPMDVVRIRLQQQVMLPDCSCGAASELKGSVGTEVIYDHVVANKNSPKIFWQDVCFQDIQCKNSALRFNSTWEAFTKISEVEGLATLWRGLSITLLMAIPANVVYFSGYEMFRDHSPMRDSYPSLNPLFCGATARMVAATTVAPLELIKTRLQSIPRSRKDTTTQMMFKDLLKETRNEIRSGGYKVLFKGLEITLWRDVPFSAIYWGSYEFYKKNFWIDFSEQCLRWNLSPNWDFFINSFIGGSVSGSSAALLTHPFDVGKTRMQITMDIENKQRNTLVSPKKRVSARGMFKFLYNIKQTEGYGALYTGLIPRVMKIAPSCAIMISTYELSKRLFAV
ncbi:Mtm1p [Kluyveromyces lactis]|uniref:KLLA0A09383p n=1 Tax=Kluyveromyces lactis (strain ATCC 8585 / CBS 2359 / DSM 70799 / NBRC 1267 / NRRL Y-1140 / WM37) TaxID=284590 RepID=Q6CXC9_KLULA|nr:uncharacterized protein KLLA0_A09383g [Kluyveromyces lactis]CAH02998.1 KLLA0A09383p [Kluyveromyces lactis]|eukprot:XP_451410.1 uncharacterized protein KLLA0_A09383g [Kluyveromyces lactis]